MVLRVSRSLFYGELSESEMSALAGDEGGLARTPRNFIKPLATTDDRGVCFCVASFLAQLRWCFWAPSTRGMRDRTDDTALQRGPFFGLRILYHFGPLLLGARVLRSRPLPPYAFGVASKQLLKNFCTWLQKADTAVVRRGAHRRRSLFCRLQSLIYSQTLLGLVSHPLVAWYAAQSCCLRAVR